MDQVLIVDDHPLVRKGMSVSFEEAMGFEVCGEAADAEEALKALEACEPHLLVLDISLPGMSGLELMKRTRSDYPDVQVLVVSRHDENLYAERVLRAGARGYVMKLEASEVIVEAARTVLDGGVYLSDPINDRLLKNLASGADEALTESPLQALSDRELEVFELTGQGLTTSDVADRLHVSVKTVESYRARIKDKLNLENASELMRHAVQWVEDEGDPTTSAQGSSD